MSSKRIAMRKRKVLSMGEKAGFELVLGRCRFLVGIGLLVFGIFSVFQKLVRFSLSVFQIS